MIIIGIEMYISLPNLIEIG